MVSFDVVTSRGCVISNGGSVTQFIEGFEMLGLSVMQSPFHFSNVKSISVPTTGFVYDLRFSGAIETIFVRKKRP